MESAHAGLQKGLVDRQFAISMHAGAHACSKLDTITMRTHPRRQQGIIQQRFCRGGKGMQGEERSGLHAVVLRTEL